MFSLSESHSRLPTLRFTLSGFQSQAHTLKFTLSGSHSQVHTLKFTLSGSHSQVHTLMFLFSESHSQELTLRHTLSVFLPWIHVLTMVFGVFGPEGRRHFHKSVEPRLRCRRRGGSRRGLRFTTRAAILKRRKVQRILSVENKR